MPTSTKLTTLLLATSSVLGLAACEPMPDDAAVEGGEVQAVSQAVGINCRPHPNQVAFFVDSNFQGDCQVFDGPASYPSWDGRLFPNDAVSSVLLGSDVGVILYADGGLSGRVLARLDDSNNLGFLANDQTSSFVIIPRGEGCLLNPGYQPKTGEVVVWDDADFQGVRCHIYRADERLGLWLPGDLEVSQSHTGSMGPPGFVPMFLDEVRNDTVSSVKVGPNTAVSIFEHDNYQGRLLANFGSNHVAAFLGGVNDMASSMAIQRE